MIEVQYRVSDGRVHAWNCDPKVTGNLQPETGEEVDIFGNMEIPPDNDLSGDYYVDVDTKTMRFEPSHPSDD